MYPCRCRAQRIPFYVGTIAPFITVYIFNWVMFVIIYFSILKQSFHSQSASSSSNSMQEKLTKIKKRLRAAVVLSVIFGLGWGLGLPATQAHGSDIMRYVFAISFNTFSAFQGTMIFIFHCIDSQDIRDEWRKWFPICFDKKSQSAVSYAFPHPAVQQKKNLNELQTLNFTSLASLQTSSNNGTIMSPTNLKHLSGDEGSSIHSQEHGNSSHDKRNHVELTVLKNEYFD